MADNPTIISDEEAGKFFAIPAPQIIPDEQASQYFTAPSKATADISPLIQNINIGGKSVRGRSELLDPLLQADSDFFKATGQHLKVNSSYRTHEEQQKLYDELKPKGAMVATPGKSRHEQGLAIDIGNWKEAAPYLAKYGLVNPFGQDKNHFQLTNKITGTAAEAGGWAASEIPGTSTPPSETPPMSGREVAPLVESLKVPAGIVGGMIGAGAVGAATMGLGTAAGALGGSGLLWAAMDQLAKYLEGQGRTEQAKSLREALIGPKGKGGQEDWGALGEFEKGVTMEATGGAWAGIMASASKAGLDVINSPKYISQQYEYISKALRPGFGKGTGDYPQQQAYFRNTLHAVHEIAEQKANLKLADLATGQRIEIPQTLEEFQQAREQLFGLKLQQTRAMEQQAGRQGVMGNLDPMLKDLLNMAKDEQMRVHFPGAAERAQELFDYYSAPERRMMAPTDMQREITALNNRTRQFQQTSGLEQKVGTATADMLAVNRLREIQNKTIERGVGPGYDELRRDMRDLITFKRDLDRRALIAARSAKKGFFDLSTIFSSYHAFKAVLTRDPATLAASLGARGLSEYYKFMNSPDRMVKALFSNAEKGLQESTYSRMMQPPSGKFTPEESRFTIKGYLPSPEGMGTGSYPWSKGAKSSEYSSKFAEQLKGPRLLNPPTDLSGMKTPSGAPPKPIPSMRPNIQSFEPGQYVGGPPGRKDIEVRGTRPDFTKPQKRVETLYPAKPKRWRGLYNEPYIQSFEPGQYVGGPPGRKDIEVRGTRPDFTKPQERVETLYPAKPKRWRDLYNEP